MEATVYDQTRKTAVIYAQKSAPDSYVCSNCFLRGHKLWREDQAHMPKLLCARCAAAEEGRDIDGMDYKGLYFDAGPERTNRIGRYIPAIPLDHDDTYWGHLTTPLVAWTWWYRFPNFIGG